MELSVMSEIVIRCQQAEKEIHPKTSFGKDKLGELLTKEDPP